MWRFISADKVLHDSGVVVGLVSLDADTSFTGFLCLQFFLFCGLRIVWAVFFCHLKGFECSVIFSCEHCCYRVWHLAGGVAIFVLPHYEN